MALRKKSLLRALSGRTAGILGLVLSCATLTTVIVGNLLREEGKDAAIRANLETVLVQAEVYRLENGVYAAGATDTCTGVFADPTVASALMAIRTANNGGTLVCNATPTFFGVVAERPSLGFFTPLEPYWCAEVGRSVCSIDEGKRGAFAGQCGCPSAP